MNGPIVLITGLLSRRLLILDWVVLALTAAAVLLRLVWGIPPNWGTVVCAVLGTVVAAELAHHYAVKWVTRDQSRIPPRPNN